MAHETAKALVAFTLLVVVFMTVLGISDWNAEPVAQESMHGIAVGLFQTHVVAFLVLGVLLTAALYAALYMAMKPDGPAEEEGEA
jgi:NADH:ubiquinone oxidoreductase subunit 6 (subunit J)